MIQIKFLKQVLENRDNGKKSAKYFALEINITELDVAATSKSSAKSDFWFKMWH